MDAQLQQIQATLAQLVLASEERRKQGAEVLEKLSILQSLSEKSAHEAHGETSTSGAAKGASVPQPKTILMKMLLPNPALTGTEWPVYKDYCDRYGAYMKAFPEGQAFLNSEHGVNMRFLYNTLETAFKENRQLAGNELDVFDGKLIKLQSYICNTLHGGSTDAKKKFTDFYRRDDIIEIYNKCNPKKSTSTSKPTKTEPLTLDKLSSFAPANGIDSDWDVAGGSTATPPPAATITPAAIIPTTPASGIGAW